VKVFVDTSAWYAVSVSGDRNHAAAVKAFNQLVGVSLITSDYVLDETLTLVRMREGHQAALKIGHTILDSASVHLERVTIDIWKTAWIIFQNYGDKEWSFTDCTSFALMDLLKVSKAFALDNNFQQYGKIALRSPKASGKS